MAMRSLPLQLFPGWLEPTLKDSKPTSQALKTIAQPKSLRIVRGFGQFVETF